MISRLHVVLAALVLPGAAHALEYNVFELKEMAGKIDRGVALPGTGSATGKDVVVPLLQGRGSLGAIIRAADTGVAPSEVKGPPILLRFQARHLAAPSGGSHGLDVLAKRPVAFTKEKPRVALRAAVKGPTRTYAKTPRSQLRPKGRLAKANGSAATSPARAARPSARPSHVASMPKGQGRLDRGRASGRPANRTPPRQAAAPKASTRGR